LLLWANFDPKLRPKVGAGANNKNAHRSSCNAVGLNYTLSDGRFQGAKMEIYRLFLPAPVRQR